MVIKIFTDNEKALKKFFPEDAVFFSVSGLSKYNSDNDELTYLDIANFTDVDLKKNITKLKNCCKNWGIIDLKGKTEDPASFFFEGACDFLGASILKSSSFINAKRMKSVLSWRKTSENSCANIPPEKSGKNDSDSFIKNGIKLPPENSFPGWKKMQTGKNQVFYLLYCSLKGKFPLDERLQSKDHARIHKRFLSCLESNFLDGDGLLWMNTGRDCLFLIPPKVKCIESAVKACIGMIVSSPQIVIESLGISFPVNFIFALHYGDVNYNPPGKTGTVVSDAINFIFHLGTKKAEGGRLTVSGDIPDKTIPQQLYDCFVPAGEFEGREIRHSKKFSYANTWV